MGNVGTGFDQKMLAGAPRARSAGHPEAPFAVNPKIPGGSHLGAAGGGAQVKFSNWTPDARLRAPVFLGLRNDVDARSTGGGRGETARRIAARAPVPRNRRRCRRVNGRQLKFTNLNKIFYPKDGYTKRDVINYYDSVAEMILPHLKDRPLSLKRYPNGIHDDFFFQKDVKETSPPGCAPSSFNSDQPPRPTFSPRIARAFSIWPTWRASIRIRG